MVLVSMLGILLTPHASRPRRLYGCMSDGMLPCARPWNGSLLIETAADCLHAAVISWKTRSDAFLL